MNHNQLNVVKSVRDNDEEKIGISNPITINDLKDKSDRTLLYGYDCDRKTCHLYLDNGKFIFVRYDGVYGDVYNVTGLDKIESSDLVEIVPNKRLYPERCDYEFCALLTKYCCNYTFTNFNENISEQQYYGMTV